MREEDYEYLNMNSQTLSGLNQSEMSNLQNQSQQAMIQEQERSMVREQLDLSEELENIEHLLRGDVLKKDDNGNLKWFPPENNEMVLLSNYGIHLIMNTINFYINKNTLLSNYEDTIINTKMEDFATDLTDTIFMEYEKVFEYPTLEDCKRVLEERMEKRKELRRYAYQIMGKEVDENKIKKEVVHEVENRIEGELKKIEQQIIKNKLKRFMLLIRTIQDAVHSTYLRAWNGAERRTLRQHITISEINAGSPQEAGAKKSSMINPSTWFSRS